MLSGVGAYAAAKCSTHCTPVLIPSSARILWPSSGEQVTFDGSGSSDPDGNPLTETWTADGGTVSGSTYTAGSVPGIYAVTTVVNDGQVDSQLDTTIVVVYDPDASFVTGGGWIDSPENAYKSAPTLTGKASFGFVSKYEKGASSPTGNTQFQAGDLNFHSDSYDWLLVNQGGSRTQFKGSGTINGQSSPNGEGYKFQLWAADGDSDKFRIKIWWETDAGDETVVYDNGVEQAIGGGSIVIHTGKQ